MSDSAITYQEFDPHVLLRDYINVYWYFSIRTKVCVPFEIMPDGYFDVMVVMKNNRIVYTMMTGIWCKSVNINYFEDVSVFAIRFKPLALGHLLHFSIPDLLNVSSSFELSDLGLNKQLILDQLNTCPLKLVEYLDRHFLSFQPSVHLDKRLKHLFTIISARSGTAPIATISDEIGLSTRQIHRKLNELIGIGAKDYSKIIRFKHTLRSIKNQKNDFWAYYDQSHFIKDFREFTGRHPTEIDLNQNVRFLQYYDFDES